MLKKTLLLVLISTLFAASCKKESLEEQNQAIESKLFSSWSSLNTFQYKKPEYNYSHFAAAIQTVLTNEGIYGKTSDVEKEWNSYLKSKGVQSLDKAFPCEYDNLYCFANKTKLGATSYNSIFTPANLKSEYNAIQIAGIISGKLRDYNIYRTGVVVSNGKESCLIYRENKKLYRLNLYGKNAQAREMKNVDVIYAVTGGSYAIKLLDYSTNFEFVGNYVAIINR